MDFKKTGLEGKVEKVIDQAADVAKEKLNTVMGGDKNKPGSGIAGCTDALNTAGTKATASAEKAATDMLNTGKKFLG